MTHYERLVRAAIEVERRAREYDDLSDAEGLAEATGEPGPTIEMMRAARIRMNQAKSEFAVALIEARINLGL